MGDKTPIDGYTGGTSLAIANEASVAGNNVVTTAALGEANTVLVLISLAFPVICSLDLFLGSIGETSALGSNTWRLVTDLHRCWKLENYCERFRRSLSNSFAIQCNRSQ